MSLTHYRLGPLVAGADGSVVIGLDWCSVGHAGGFFASQDEKVLTIDFDAAPSTAIATARGPSTTSRPSEQ